MWTDISTHISSVMGQSFVIENRHSVGGGSINQAFCIQDQDQKFFLKLNRAAKVAMFESEALGLQEMAEAKRIRVPTPICWGVTEQHSYIVLEWIDLGAGSGEQWHQMGCQLAKLHQKTSLQGFGWHRNNTIGDTPQQNSWQASWLKFYGRERLHAQLTLGQRRGGKFRQQAVLLDKLPQLLANHDPVPSLVHGDLWSGNAAFSTSGEPIILDPATYYGDREVDIAMTELFGGFPRSFYAGYESIYPLESGYGHRKTLYNLYHVLNHFNLFGGSYEGQANRMIQELLLLS